MTSEQLTNAQIIVQVGQQLGVSAKQLLAAIEAGLVESGLRNLNYGDRDSRGIFQQRPSQGWGTIAQIMDPYYAAQAFFVGAGSNPGALTVNQSGSAGSIAGRVQRPDSRYLYKYDQQENAATEILGTWQISTDQSGGDTWSGDYFGVPDLSQYDFVIADAGEPDGGSSSSDGGWTESPAPTPQALSPALLIVIAVFGYLGARQIGIV